MDICLLLTLFVEVIVVRITNEAEMKCCVMNSLHEVLSPILLGIPTMLSLPSILLIPIVIQDTVLDVVV